MDLVLYADYTRKDVHDVFAPDSPFTPGAAQWGLHGIIKVPDRPGDFVFFVSFGREIAEHEFDEGITRDGVLSWQSQPSQALDNPQVQQFTEHDEDANSIYLFLRTSTRPEQPYTYLGQLKYLRHDESRERPVYFQWQILDWDIPKGVLQRMNLVLEDPQMHWGTGTEASVTLGTVVEPPPRTPSKRSHGERTSSFRSRKSPDWGKRDAYNRKLGKAGEIFVVDHERRELRSNGRTDLAKKVRHIAREEGDGAGYDVLSFNLEGSKKFIEVKTTRGPATSDFYLSENERRFSILVGEQYYLYRVFEFDLATEEGNLFILRGPLTDNFWITPVEYKARR